MIDLGEDDGFVEVKVGSACVRVDLFQVRSQLVDLHETHKDKTNEEYTAAIVALVGKLGLPTVSFKAAAAFQQKIFDACESEKNGLGGSVASAASMASTPAA